VGEVDALLWPLLEGLQQVHEAGFLHRDIKPTNVFIGTEGKPTLIDFGASRAAMVGRTVDLTAIFTPGYAAPEQFTSAKQGPWTDIYGLAATLYHAITGKAPPGAFDRLVEDRYEPLVRRQPAGFARSLMIGIDAGLSLHANERPQTILGWRALLGQAPPVSEATVVMMPPPTTAAAPKSQAGLAVVPRRVGTGRWMALGTALVLVLAGGGYYAFTPSPQPSAVVVAADADTKRALQEADAGRRKAEAEIEKLRADAARREVEVEAADKKRLEQAAARQQMEADAEARRKAEEQNEDGGRRSQGTCRSLAVAGG
jgi:serine/threonine protein kinase